MRILMLGTGPFAVPTFRRLYETPWTIAALVTRPVYGKGPAPVNLMREIAHARGTPVIEPESINAPDARAALAAYQPDLLVVCDYGQILSPETLSLSRLGGVNLHASLLPKYRGAAPINWAIYHGETETGVSVIHMTPRVDAGPVIAQLATPIGPEETAEELEPRLAELGAPLVVQAIEDLVAGRATPIEQDPLQASRAPRLKKDDGLVDWTRPAAAIKNQVRAMQPWPKTYTLWHRDKGEPLRLILEQVSVVADRGGTGVSPVQHGQDASGTQPGTIIEAVGDRLLVATGSGALALERIQPAGKRVLTAAEFLRGYPLRFSERLGGGPTH